MPQSPQLPEPTDPHDGAAAEGAAAELAERTAQSLREVAGWLLPGSWPWVPSPG